MEFSRPEYWSGYLTNLGIEPRSLYQILYQLRYQGSPPKLIQGFI